MSLRRVPFRIAVVLAPLAAALVSTGPAVAPASAAGGSAAIKTTTASTPPPATRPTAKPKPKPKPKPTSPATSVPPTSTGPAKASARLYVLDTFFLDRQPITVPKRTLHVAGVVRPFVAGQWVSVRTFLGRKLIKSDRLRIKRSPNGTYGAFTESVSSPGVGDVSVDVNHVRNTQMLGWKSSRTLSVLDDSVGFGSTGRFVQLIQQRLAALHFYIPQTGVYDQGTGLAVDAYHRMLHRGTSQSLDAATASSLLDGIGTFEVRDPRAGTHAEGNLSVQLLALVNGSHVYRIYPISSGKPSTPTVLGHFSVYERVPGYLPDGMYYSDFFIGGYAIHGYDPAPDYPASHGCMRLPIVDAISAFNWLNYGDVVDVYY
jgi:L,D-transpeptidase catalytic domain